MTTCYWITHLGLIPKEDWFSLFQQSLFAYSSSSRFETCEIYFNEVGLCTSITIVMVLFKQPNCWNFMGAVLLSCIVGTVSQQATLSLWFCLSGSNQKRFTAMQSKSNSPHHSPQIIKPMFQYSYGATKIPDNEINAKHKDQCGSNVHTRFQVLSIRYSNKISMVISKKQMCRQ